MNERGAHTFGRRLKIFRLDRQWTLRQMANATGLDIRTIWNIENDKVRPHELTVAKIKKAIPVDLGDPQEIAS